MIFIFFITLAHGSCDETSFKVLAKIISENNFVTYRSIEFYFKVLGEEFKDHYLTLKSGDSILDLGAGQGIAARNMAGLGGVEKGDYTSRTFGDDGLLFLKAYFKNKEFPNVLAVSYEYEGTPENTSQFKHLVGSFFEDIDNKKLKPFGDTGYKLVSDALGVVAYTNRLSEALEKSVTLMSPEGKFFIFVGKKNSSFTDRTIKNAKKGQLTWNEGSSAGLWHTVIQDGNNYKTFPEWVAGNAKLDVRLNDEGVLIIKKKSDAKPPFFSNLELVNAKDLGDPPYPRIFRVVR